MFMLLGKIPWAVLGYPDRPDNDVMENACLLVAVSVLLQRILRRSLPAGETNNLLREKGRKKYFDMHIDQIRKKFFNV